jgi:predicted nucleic acid-binding protein
MIVFDTGALIAVERRRQRMLTVWAAAIDARRPILVPGVVLAEWWRGRSDRREDIVAGVTVVPVDALLGRMAGEALGAIAGATVVDAIVMSLAARHEAVTYTSDLDDLEALRGFYPGVRVLST